MDAFLPIDNAPFVSLRTLYYKKKIKSAYLKTFILDLYDRRIVSYVFRDNNNNSLVFNTFDKAIAENRDAHPLCHSDCGFNVNAP